MPSNPVNWFEIQVQDIERARRFYEQVFQVQLEKMPNLEMEYWAFPMDDSRMGAGGALLQREGGTRGSGGTLVYFSCDDCAVEQGRVVGAGGRVLQEKMSIGEYGHIALVEDSEGNPIGLHSLI